MDKKLFEQLFESVKQADEILRGERALERRAYRLNELPREIIEGIAAAKMDPAHQPLNSLLTDR